MSESSFVDPSVLIDKRSWAVRHARLVIGCILLFSALTYFAYSAFQGSQLYYLTVQEVVNGGASEHPGPVRVNGKLVQGSFERLPGQTLANFKLTDLTYREELHLEYDGVVPDLFFNEHSQIVAQGKYGEDGLFKADLLIVKCPSKYASELPTT